MNFIFISPNFPDRFFKFAESLSSYGVNVLGIGDCPYDNLHSRLKKALNEYYYLPSLNDYDSVRGAVSFFQNKYGEIAYIESNNEWWLNLDAKLREDFNIKTGFHPKDMMKIKAKSEMKKCFQKAGVKTMRYILVNGIEDMLNAKMFAVSVGFPLFAKPNVGVGASNSYKLENKYELEAFLSQNLDETYIIEEYINGHVVSYDGIVDGKGNVVFDVMDVFMVSNADLVNKNYDDFYYANPFELDCVAVDKMAFREAGRSAVKSFGIKNRFFHIEFFVLDEDKQGLANKGEIVGLECNMRSPGGNTPDLIDYACSLSVYNIYASVVANGTNNVDLNEKKYYCATISRRDSHCYRYSDEDIRNKYGDKIKMSGRYPRALAADMGDSYYFVRVDTLDEVFEFRAFCSLA